MSSHSITCIVFKYRIISPQYKIGLGEMILAIVMSSITGNFSTSTHIACFSPSLAFFNDMALSSPLIGSLNFGKVAMTSFKIPELKPTSVEF